MIPALAYFIYKNEKSIDKLEFKQKYDYFFEDIKIDYSTKYIKCFKLIRQWLSIFFLVFFSAFPMIQLISFGIINACYVLLYIWYFPFLNLSQNYLQIIIDIFICICNIALSLLLCIWKSVYWFNFCSKLVFCSLAIIMALPFIFNITQTLSNFCKKKESPSN